MTLLDHGRGSPRRLISTGSAETLAPLPPRQPQQQHAEHDLNDAPPICNGLFAADISAVGQQEGHVREAHLSQGLASQRRNASFISSRAQYPLWCTAAGVSKSNRSAMENPFGPSTR